jgi:hypothetical protein
MSYSLNLNINYSDPPHIMREKIEKALAETKRDKYNFILEFLNEIFNKECKSLLEFKNVNFNDITKNTEHLKNVYIDNKDTINEKFGIEIQCNDVTIKTFTSLISKLAKKIDYSVVKKTYGEKVLCTIKN